MRLLLMAYFAGVLLGLWQVDAPPAGRMVLALLWPVGLAACVATISILLVAAAVLFPMLGAVAFAGGVAGWWMLR